MNVVMPREEGKAPVSNRLYTAEMLEKHDSSVVEMGRAFE